MKARPRFERALRAEATGPTPQRLAHARRAIQKDIEANALTPELVKPWNSDPETRIEKADARYLYVARALRKTYADHWREGRRLLDTLDTEMREICVAYWNRGAFPMTGTYFVCHVKRCIDHPERMRENWAFLNRHR